jgi:uncharacterized membrane protein
MVLSWRRALLPVVLAIGLVLRLWIAWRLGPTGDTRSFAAAAQGFRQHGLHFYSHVNAYDAARPYTYRNFSYPPGYIPVLLVAEAASKGPFPAGIQFWQVARVVPIVADITTAWLVQAYLPRNKYGLRVAAATVIAIGPSFIVSSASEAQLDSVAILPAVVAVLLWKHGGARRALWAGLLIGVGAAIKTIPIIMILALFPTAFSRREALRLGVAAFAVPVLALLPFALVDPAGTSATLRYAGFPGAGGVALLLQPGLARHYLGDYDLSSAYPLLQHWGWILPAAGVAGTAFLCVRARLNPVSAATLLWLVVYALSANWYPQYLAWGSPFLLMSGYVVSGSLAQAVLIPTLLFAYRAKLSVISAAVPTGRTGSLVYAVLMDVLWLAAASAALILLRRLAVLDPRLGSRPMAWWK